MKKFFILSLIAILTTISSANAQENTYSVVIKLANGTTLTIGPNDVENITFTDGQVIASGHSIQDLMARIAANEEGLKKNEYELMSLEKQQADLFENENRLAANMMATDAKVATIQAEVAKVEASISTTVTAVNAVQRAVVSSRDEFKQELADLAAKTKETDARIADIAIQQESTIANLANQISALQSQINALQQEIENLKKQ